MTGFYTFLHFTRSFHLINLISGNQISPIHDVFRQCLSELEKTNNTFFVWNLERTFCLFRTMKIPSSSSIRISNNGFHTF